MSHSKRSLLSFLVLGFSIAVNAQPQVFERSDFELRGPVKNCTVITDYGEERFEFDRDGKLLKSLTRYSDTDYEITHYRYQDTVLTERRDEVYRDGTFDKSTSFAHFYQIDTRSIPGDLIEKITSYDQKITEQITYKYDSIGRVSGMIRVHEEGIDETRVVYTSHEGEVTSEFFLNGQLSKSIRISEKDVSGKKHKITLLKSYFQGVPQKAEEEIEDASGRIVEVNHFSYDPVKEAFRKEEFREFIYNEAGLQSGETTTYYSDKSGGSRVQRVSKKEFIYQTDGQSPGNWIKKIVTPQNSYTTRRITYYTPVEAKPNDSLPRN
jgi:hypothetical protein